jgi:hypothetical protein
MRRLSHNDLAKVNLSDPSLDRESLKEERRKKMRGSNMTARQEKEK